MERPGEAGTRRIVRFGAFEADLKTGELRKYGIRIKIAEQPFLVLEPLLERPGELVTRDEFKQRLWPGNIHVDFNRSLNAAVKKLRSALEDSPRNPRFVETRQKRGYCFVAPTKSVPRGHGAAEATPADEVTTGPGASSQRAMGAAGKRAWNWTRPAIALAVALLVAVLWQAAQNPSAETLGSPSQRQLDSFRFDEGRISPDGRYIAYTSAENYQLRLRDLRSRSDRLLVGERTAPELAWSPDSRRLALATGRDGVYRLEILSVESGERQVLRQGASFDEVRVPFAWDSVGNRLLCGARDGKSLGFLGLRDLTLTPVKMPRLQIHRPALSPDGRFLAYHYRNGRFFDVEIVATSGASDPIEIADFPSSGERYAFWAAGGRMLLFMRGFGIGGDRYEMWGRRIDPKDGLPQGTPFKLPAAPDPYYELFHPAVMSNGEVVFARRARLSRVHLLAVDPESGEARGGPESDFPERSSGKHWAPEGMKFYYWDPSVRWQVISDVLAFRERDIATGEERIHQIPWPELAWTSFSYSSDHSKGLFVANAGRGRARALYLFDAETRQLSELLGLEQESGMARFSNDGKDAAFVERPRSAEDWELKVIDLSRVSVRTLTQTSRSTLQWSPDDTEIAFVADNCLRVAPVAAGQSVTLACGPPLPQAWPAADGWRRKPRWHNPMGFSWSPDGRMLAWAVAVPEKRRVELWVVDRDTGKRRVVWAGGAAYSRIPLSPKWSPDGKLIAFTMAGQAPVEVWAMRSSVSSDPQSVDGGAGLDGTIGDNHVTP